MILAFFASSDGIINLNLRERFLKEIKIPEAQCAYGFQLMMENIHGETYSDMLENIVSDVKDREYLFQSIKTIPSIKKISDWAIKWIESSENIGKRIIAFAIVEGIFFSGAFASIFWLKTNRSHGVYFMNGLFKSNKFIARDEGLHTNFACILYSFIKNRVSDSEVYTMFNEAIEIISLFNKDAIKCDMIGLNIDLLNQYIKYVADRLLQMLNYKKQQRHSNCFLLPLRDLLHPSA
jgi:ribonucleotide reductase beta subunit family protein with ferritin-like domain